METISLYVVAATMLIGLEADDGSWVGAVRTTPCNPCVAVVFVDDMEAIFVDKAPDKTATEFAGSDFRSHMVLLPTNFIE